MSETLLLDKSLDKKQKYEQIIPQIKAVIDPEDDLIANLANTASILRMAFDFFWVGFYLKKDNELVLGPFQGDLACTRIPIGKGVCGASASKKETIIVPDVNQFDGHIACSALTQSEIVVPLISDDQCMLVLDVDSKQIDDFDNDDKTYLNQIINLISQKHYS